MTEWGDVRVLLEVARAGNLSAAARGLGVNNTTVGRRLVALEKALGAKLVARTPDGLSLTPAGEAIRAAGEEMERSMLQAEQQALGMDRKLSGVVRVASTEFLGETIVMPALVALKERHPHIRVDLFSGSARVDLSRREADVALRFIRPDTSELVARRAGTVAFGTYASTAYLARAGMPERGSGFGGHDIVTFDTSVRIWLQGQLAGEELRDARVVLRGNSTNMLVAAVRLGLGIGPMPCSVARRYPDLVAVPTGGWVERDPFWLVIHADVQRTSRVRAVIDVLEARLAAIGEEISN